MYKFKMNFILITGSNGYIGFFSGMNLISKYFKMFKEFDKN